MMNEKEFSTELKNKLTIEQVMDLVAELGGEPRLQQGGYYFTAKTICHGGNSHKLYYYSNTHLFHCYTECSPETFDIYELVRKVNARQNAEWSLPLAIKYVASYFNFSNESFVFSNELVNVQDWKIIDKYNKISSNMDNKVKRIDMKFYNKDILKHLPCPHIIPWEEEGITYEIIKDYGIRYDPVAHGVVIPHYDVNDNLIGIRERTLIKEEEKYGKYKPAILNGEMYNHPLGFALYNLNKSKENIKRIKAAVVTEGEKSCLKYASFFGVNNDISVAVCGSNLINYQVELLRELGVREIIIAFDKQFQKSGDEEFKRWTQKLTEIHKKYSSKVQISFIFDKENLLDYKESPLDRGPDIFMKLFKKRIIL